MTKETKSIIPCQIAKEDELISVYVVAVTGTPGEIPKALTLKRSVLDIYTGETTNKTVEFVPASVNCTEKEEMTDCNRCGAKFAAEMFDACPFCQEEKRTIKERRKGEVIGQLWPPAPEASEQLDAESAIYAATAVLAGFLIKKNRAYSNAAFKSINKFSKASALDKINIRMDDKLTRLINGTEYAEEDSIKDLVGYWVLREAYYILKSREENKIDPV